MPESYCRIFTEVAKEAPFRQKVLYGSIEEISHSNSLIKAYIAVGSMHNFSYLGGMTGLLGGVLYSVLKSERGLLPFTSSVRK